MNNVLSKPRAVVFEALKEEPESDELFDSQLLLDGLLVRRGGGIHYA